MANETQSVSKRRRITKPKYNTLEEKFENEDEDENLLYSDCSETDPNFTIPEYNKRRKVTDNSDDGNETDEDDEKTNTKLVKSKAKRKSYKKEGSSNCPVCGILVKNYYLATHIQLHSKPRSACIFPECLFTCTRNDNLKIHFFKMHKDHVAIPESAWKLRFDQLFRILESEIAKQYPTLVHEPLALPTVSNAEEKDKVIRPTPKRMLQSQLTNNPIDDANLVAPLLALPLSSRTVLSNFFLALSEKLVETSQPNQRKAAKNENLAAKNELTAKKAKLENEQSPAENEQSIAANEQSPAKKPPAAKEASKNTSPEKKAAEKNGQIAKKRSAADKTPAENQKLSQNEKLTENHKPPVKVTPAPNYKTPATNEEPPADADKTPAENEKLPENEKLTGNHKPPVNANEETPADPDKTLADKKLPGNDKIKRTISASTPPTPPLNVNKTHKLPCPYCDDRFNKKRELLLHYFKTHPTCAEIQQYICSKCNKHFGKSSEKTSHELQCHPKQFRCGLCKQQFPRLEILQQHFINIHSAPPNTAIRKVDQEVIYNSVYES